MFKSKMQFKKIFYTSLSFLIILAILLLPIESCKIFKNKSKLPEESIIIIPPQENTASKTKINIQELELYADIVKPILAAKCYSCHGAEKQKGDLRLDNLDSLILVNATDYLLVKGKAESSAIIRRMLLHESDFKHMPPNSFPQPSQYEKDFLVWWVNAGAQVNIKVKELDQTEKILQLFTTPEVGTVEKIAPIKYLPETPIAAADYTLIKQITEGGVAISQVVNKNNYLSVNLLGQSKNADSLLQVLYPLKDHIIWLKLDNAHLKDTSLRILSTFSALRKLSLINAEFDGEELQKLHVLSNLQSINLTGTEIAAEDIYGLKTLTQLRHLYIFKTQVKQQELNGLKMLFPNTKIEYGNYSLPFLTTDTAIAK